MPDPTLVPPPGPPPAAGPMAADPVPPAVVARAPSMRSVLLPLGLSLAVLAGVLAFTWDAEAFRTMAGVLRPGVLALAPLALLVQYVLGGYRLRHVSHGRVPTLRRGIRGSIAWDFMSAVTPSAIGGAPVAAYFVAKDNGFPVGQATSVMLFAMLLDQVWFATTIPLLFGSLFFFNVFPPALGHVGTGSLSAYFLFMLGWVAFFAYATVVRPEIIERVAARVVRIRWLRRFEGRVREEMIRLKEQARVLRKESFGFYFRGYLFSAGIWMCRYLVVLFVVWSVVPDLEAVKFLFRTGAMWLTALLIPTPGGSGGIEGLYLLFLAPMMPRAVVGPTLLVWRLLIYYLVLVVGPFVTLRQFGKRRAAPIAP